MRLPSYLQNYFSVIYATLHDVQAQNKTIDTFVNCSVMCDLHNSEENTMVQQSTQYITSWRRGSHHAEPFLSESFNCVTRRVDSLTSKWS